MALSKIDLFNEPVRSVSLLQWHLILNTSSSLPPIHIYNGMKYLRGWKYELWPESAISRECWGMACKAWPESTISHERRGMAQLHRTRTKYEAPLWTFRKRGGGVDILETAVRS